MPIDPTIARGVVPLGEGVANTLMAVEELRRRRAAEGELKRRNDLLQAAQEWELKSAKEDRATAQGEAEKKHALAKVEWALESGNPKAALMQDPQALEQFRAQGVDIAALPDDQVVQMLTTARGKIAGELGIRPEQQKKPGTADYDPSDYDPASWAQFQQSGDPNVLKRYQAPQSYAPAGYREVTLMEGGKPVVYMVNERNPADRRKLGEGKGDARRYIPDGMGGFVVDTGDGLQAVEPKPAQGAPAQGEAAPDLSKLEGKVIVQTDPTTGQKKRFRIQNGQPVPADMWPGK